MNQESSRYAVLEDRVVALCEQHAAELDSASVRNLDDAASLFQEDGGRRSELPRRTPLDRRAFPPRPEGRRMGDDRREAS